MFSVDHPAFQRNRIAYTFVCVFGLSILWLLGLGSVVLFGPVTVACYYCAVKVIRRGREKLLPQFWKAFKENLKTGIPLGLAVEVLAWLCVVAIRFSSFMGSEDFLWSMLSYVYFFLLVLLGCFAVMAFPAFSRFKMTLGHGLRFSGLLTLKHLFTAFTCLLVWVLGALVLRWLSGLVLVLPAVCMIVCSLVIEQVLRKYITEAPDEDAWYL